VLASAGFRRLRAGLAVAMIAWAIAVIAAAPAGASIGPGSCQGANACLAGVPGTVGSNSCDGQAACQGVIAGIVGNNSCETDYGCEGGVTSTGSVGNNSCNGNDHACSGGVSASVGKSSCRGQSACAGGVSASVGDKSCSGSFACVGGVSASVGDSSCSGSAACYSGVSASVGDNSCGGNAACYNGVKATVGNNSCNGPHACQDPGGVVASVGDCQRNVPGHVPAACQGPALDHFKCYVPGNPGATPIVPQFGGAVSLQDEFDGTSFESVAVGALFRFCNPVAKTYLGVVTPVTNPDVHLSIYAITTTTTGTHTIVASNQFGSAQSMQVGPPSWLAVPTAMNSNNPPNPAALGHFKCYPVKQIKVDLYDPAFNHTEPGVAIGAPFMFCNPAEKIHVVAGTSTTYPVVSPTRHLLCYSFAFSPFATSLKILNQFNATGLGVTGADLLCLPTTLISATVP